MASRMISLKEIEVKKSMLKKKKTIFASDATVFVLPVILLGSLEKNDMKKVHNVKAKASLKLEFCWLTSNDTHPSWSNSFWAALVSRLNQIIEGKIDAFGASIYILA